MIANLIAVGLLAQQALPPRDDPPRLRTTLLNGSVVLVEKIPGARATSVQLWVSAKGTKDNPTNQGLRHLLEHLVARGLNRTLDQRLETAGGFLQARTYRDAMVFEVTISPKQLAVGVSALQEMFRLGTIEADAITHEAQIIREEGALRGSTATLADAAWRQAYGDQGLDPFGDLDTISHASPEAITKLHRAMFGSQNLAITIAGDVDLDAATALAKDVLAPLAKSEVAPEPPPTFHADATVANCSGHARAAGVGSFQEVATLATLAAGLAVASEVPHAFLTYTPSDGPSLILIGVTTRSNPLETALKSDPVRLYNRGKQLVRRWLNNQLDSPADIASARGHLLCENPTLRPETLSENLASLSFEAFRAGLARFQTGNAIVVEGVQ